MVWTPSEEGWWVCWDKDAGDGVAGREGTGGPEGRFVDVVKEDMAEVGVAGGDTVGGRGWRKKIRCGEP